MKAIHIVMLLLFSYNITFAWTEINGNIRGLVSNLDSGRPIRGATLKLVYFEDKKEITKTYSQDAGEFIFSNIKPGIYDVECSAFGFKTTRLIGLQVKEDQTKLAYIKLVRGPAAEINEVYSYASIQAQQKIALETSSSIKESIEDAPATVYIVTSDDIESRGYTGLNELLLDVPEFEIQERHSNQSYNAISARGIYGNEKILILINGVRYNSMTNNQYAITENYNIRYAKRVEIILGPASALYGADAYMGVINIITKEGDAAKGFSLSSSYGMYNTTNNSFQFGVGNKDVSFAMSGGAYYSDGVNLNAHYPEEFYFYNQQYLQNGTILSSPVDPTGATQTIPIKPFDLSRFSYFVEGNLKFKDFNIGIFHNQEQHSSSTGALPYYSPYWKEARYGSSLTSINAQHTYKPKKSRKWTLKSLLNATFMFTPNNSKIINTFSNYQDAYNVGTNAGVRLSETFNYKINDQHQLAFGLTGQYSAALPRTGGISQQQTTVFFPMRTVNAADLDIYYLGTNATDVDGNSLKLYQELYYIRRTILGAFGEYKLKLHKKLLLTLGARFDQVIDISEYAPTKDPNAYNSINPRLGIVYKPMSNLNIKLFYGEGFLQPSPDHKYDHFGAFYPVADESGGYTHIEGDVWRIPNEQLKPEKVRSFELSSKYAKGDFSISLNSYFNLIENSIIYETNFINQTFNGIPVKAAEKPVNSTSNTLSYGSTLRVDYRYILERKERAEFRIHGSYSYADGNIEGLEHLPFTAKHTVKAGLLFKFYNFSLNNSLIYRSSTYNEGFTDTEGEFFQVGNASFVLWNLFSKYTVVKKRKFSMDIFVKINNVLNSKYYHTTDNTPISFGASPQDPIRFSAGLSINIGK